MNIQLNGSKSEKEILMETKYTKMFVYAVNYSFQKEGKSESAKIGVKCNRYTKKQPKEDKTSNTGTLNAHSTQAQSATNQWWKCSWACNLKKMGIT